MPPHPQDVQGDPARDSFRRMKRTPGRFRRWWRGASTRRRIGVFLAASFVASFLLILFAWYTACSGTACPAISRLNEFDPVQASKVFAADGRRIFDYGTERRTVKTLKEMSPAIPAAFLAVEDKRFYEHHGVDWVRFFGAIKNNILSGGMNEGFSTITMQLAGNLFPDEIDRRRRGIGGIPRKIREARFATEIERRYSKQKILELYLNQISLGSRAFGVEEASQRYFGKSSEQLNVAEAAMLAALPKAPERYNPRKSPRAAITRRNVVIDLLRETGALTSEEADTWKAYPLALSAKPDNSALGKYFVEYVRL
jgi:penicillin-binding protein 1A